MFIHKYLSDFYLGLIMYEYDTKYLCSLDEAEFIKIYNLFKDYNFFFIEDIVLKYLEIFSMNYDDVYKGINLLREKLGDNFVNIIGNDMRYLDEIIKINVD